MPIVHTPGRAADFAGATVSGERAAAELDWRPQTSFAEGVERYVAWHVEDAAARAALAAAAPDPEPTAGPLRPPPPRRASPGCAPRAPARCAAPYAQSAVSGVLALIVYGYLMTSIGLARRRDAHRHRRRGARGRGDAVDALDAGQGRRLADRRASAPRC